MLKVQLPNWLHVCDTISVWKRSETCTIVFAVDDDEDGNGEEGEEEEEEVEYRHIPPEERLPTNIAAPCLQHLLLEHDGHDDVKPKKKQLMKHHHHDEPERIKDDDDDAPSPSSQGNNSDKKKKAKKHQQQGRHDEGKNHSPKGGDKDYLCPW